VFEVSGSFLHAARNCRLCASDLLEPEDPGTPLTFREQRGVMLKNKTALLRHDKTARLELHFLEHVDSIVLASTEAGIKELLPSLSKHVSLNACLNSLAVLAETPLMKQATGPAKKMLTNVQDIIGGLIRMDAPAVSAKDTSFYQYVVGECANFFQWEHRPSGKKWGKDALSAYVKHVLGQSDANVNDIERTRPYWYLLKVAEIEQATMCWALGFVGRTIYL
jgi:hypothetical protein